MAIQRTWPALAGAVLLVGCASLSPDGGVRDVRDAAAPGLMAMGVPQTKVGPALTEQTQQAVAQLLEQSPLTMDSAVRIALLNNPSLHSSMAQLRISEAERVQAATLPNPHFSLMRAVEGDKVMVEHALGINVLGMLALPWRSQWAGQQHEMAKLQAAQNVIRLAADTRKAWIRAVAAQQAAHYAAQAKGAAEAAGELARRMARVGNWSRLKQAKEQSLLAEAAAAQSRAENTAFAEREKLIRLMGLWGEQTRFQLPERLPPLPAEVMDAKDLEARALAQRLDVRAAVQYSGAVARNAGYVRATGLINALDVKWMRETTTDQATGEREKLRGWEMELPIPIFDWGGAANARAQASYMQAVAQVRATAIHARSEAREAWHSYRTAHDLAKHYRDEVVPLRKFINDETLLRYNGMLIGVFDLLADTRANIMTVSASMDALRDFWLLETDLQTALTGTSPGGLSNLSAATASTAESKPH